MLSQEQGGVPRQIHPPEQLKVITQPNKTGSSSVVGGIMLELDRLQGEQVQLARKIERERQRKELLESDLSAARTKLRTFQDATKGGSIVKDEDTVSRKLIAKLEHSLQQARIKLSATHKENGITKRKIDETRQDKIMHLNILRNLEKEYHDSKIKIAAQQKEIIEVNEEKHRLDVKISNMKEEMFRDMNHFSNELVMTKRNISQTQTNILESIRERLQNTFNNLDLLDADDDAMQGDKSQHTHTHKPNNEAEERRIALQELLDEVGVDTLEKLIVTLQQSEEASFNKYNDIQSATAEMEKLDLENKHLKEELAQQTTELEELDSSNEKKQKDLGLSIASIQSATAKYEADLAVHEAALSLMQNNLVKLFKNIAIDEAADQQILENGVNDRNIPDYLGIVEQRIDDLIQMRKAAEHQLLEREDFGKSAYRKKEGSLVRPALPDSRVEAPDEDFGDDDGTGKVQPVSINMLKEFMHRKVQRGLKKRDLSEALAKAGKVGKPGQAAIQRDQKLDDVGAVAAEHLETAVSADMDADQNTPTTPSKRRMTNHQRSEAKRRGTKYVTSTNSAESAGTPTSKQSRRASTQAVPTSPISSKPNSRRASASSVQGPSRTGSASDAFPSRNGSAAEVRTSSRGSITATGSSAVAGSMTAAARIAVSQASDLSGTFSPTGDAVRPASPPRRGSASSISSARQSFDVK